MRSDVDVFWTFFWFSSYLVTVSFKEKIFSLFLNNIADHYILRKFWAISWENAKKFIYFSSYLPKKQKHAIITGIIAAAYNINNSFFISCSLLIYWTFSYYLIPKKNSYFKIKCADKAFSMILMFSISCVFSFIYGNCKNFSCKIRMVCSKS